MKTDRIYFYDCLDKTKIIYILDFIVNPKHKHQDISSKIESEVYSMFKVVRVDKARVEQDLNNKSEKIVIGPIKSFKSVFDTTTTDILNRNKVLRYISRIIKFEKLLFVDASIEYDNMLQEQYSIEDILNDLSIKTIKTNFDYKKEISLECDNIMEILEEFGISFDDQELAYYRGLYQKIGRNPNLIELFDLCQSNSEHSRHWFFNGEYMIDDNLQSESLFKMVKSTLVKDKEGSNSLVAFSDNSSVIEGDFTKVLKVDKNEFYFENEVANPVLTAETHNFPTLICPFEGASTGVGGRIRDNHSTGKGARIQQSLAGYCVGETNRTGRLFQTPYMAPIDMLIEASNGASDYGNKIGEPIVGGFTRGIGGIEKDSKYYEYLKPIMFSAGIGVISDKNLHKELPKGGDLIIRLGGPVYKIGLGGGFNSSIDNKSEMTQNSRDAVQRGDPQMENKLNRVITRLSNMNINNPINSIHDQGAGGLANVLKEIVYPNGGIINLDKVTLGDSSIEALEIWCSEFQESSVILVSPENVNLVLETCREENVIADFVGEVWDKDSVNFGSVHVYFREEKVVDFTLEPILNPHIRKRYELTKINETITEKTMNNVNLKLTRETFRDAAIMVLSDLDVCSKRFLTTKVDRSVTGLVAQQQCVGPYGVPCADFSANSFSFNDVKGSCSSIGEKPLIGLFSEKHQAQYSLVEMLTNLAGAYINDIEKIKCSVNWMWANKSLGEARKLYTVARELTEAMKILGVGIDGGKDSLSMSVNISDNEYKYTEVVSPGNVVVTSYAYSPNLNRCRTSDLKDMISILIYIPFTDFEFTFNKKTPSLLGSVLWKNLVKQTSQEFIDQDFKNILLNGTSLPSEINFTYVKMVFNLIQNMLKNYDINSIHDVSDGGLFTTIFEMAYSGYKGVNISGNFDTEVEIINFLFSEEPGVVIEVSNIKWIEHLRPLLGEKNIPYKMVGWSRKSLEMNFSFTIGSDVKEFNFPLSEFQAAYESLTTHIELKQSSKICVDKETEYLKTLFKNIDNKEIFISNPVDWYIPKKVFDKIHELSRTPENSFYKTSSSRKQVLILRDEGSNGDLEMGAFFKLADFDVLNYNLNKLELDPDVLKRVDGIVFVGGFTFSDIMGSAACWANRIKNNEQIHNGLIEFFEDNTKFTIGVCNGFQLLIKLGVFGNNIHLVSNDSGRFESRFSTLEVDYVKRNLSSQDIFFKDMNSTCFGMWVAHGEGKIVIDNNVEGSYNFIPVLKYVTNNKQDYPQNPNGSHNDIAGVVSKNGRILGLMPHFERSFLSRQCAYIPNEYTRENIKYTPWFYISENINDFLRNSKN